MSKWYEVPANRQTGAYTWRCPVCLEPVKNEQDFRLHCPECAKAGKLPGAEPGKRYIFPATNPKSLEHPYCPKHPDRAWTEMRNAPFLVHINCGCRNPLWTEGEGGKLSVPALEKGEAIMFVDPETSQKREVAHWTLCRIREAANDVGDGVDLRGMWFPAAMLPAMKPESGGGTRVLLRGPFQVGKTVFSSRAISDTTFVSTSDGWVEVENFVYASPVVPESSGLADRSKTARDRSGGGDALTRSDPWQIYAAAIQSVESLNDFVSPVIAPTITGDVRRADRFTIYGGFFRVSPRDATYKQGQQHILLIYDIAGEDSEHNHGPEIQRLDTSTDLTYLFIDVRDLGAVHQLIGKPEPDPKTEAKPTSSVGSIAAAYAALKSNPRKPTIIVLTKLDCIPDKASSSAAQSIPLVTERKSDDTASQAIQSLQDLKQELWSSGWPHFTPVNPIDLGKRSLAILKRLLASGSNIKETTLLERIQACNVEAAFFVWVEGLPDESGTIKKGEEPVSYGIAPLVRYTMGRSKQTT